MAESKPVTYVKGKESRVVYSAADRVQAVYLGFKPEKAPAPKSDAPKS